MNELRIVDESTGEIAITGATFTKTGLTLDPNTPYEQWEALGGKLQEVEGGVQWWIGDWLNFGEHKYGEMYAQAVDEKQAHLWQEYKWVAKAVESCNRLQILSWTHHFQVAALEPDEQNYWLNKALEEGMSVSDLRKAIKQEKALLNQPEFPAGTYEVIYADPPWSYENSGFNQSAEMQYPTMSTDDICALRVNELANENTVLFMWATSPLLPDAIRVIEAWGFQYRASMVWVKDRAPGMGWWLNTKHELLLIASKGINHPLEKLDSVIMAPVRKHSQKPEEFYEAIEKMYKGNKIELFAREAREGWEAWGNEVKQ